MTKLMLIPGPTKVDEEVLLELSKQVIPHYGLEWKNLYDETANYIKQIFNTTGYITLLPLPGTVSIELGIFNVIENAGDKVICLNNGFFMDQIERQLRSHGANIISLKSDYGFPLNTDLLDETIRENPDVKAIFMVHNETSTGVLNDVAKVGRIVRKYDKLLCVDAVSSFGGIEFDFDSWGVDYAVGYASKCLSGINGIVPVAISDRFFNYVNNRKVSVKSYFFNLSTYLEMSEFTPNHPHPTSMPTSVVSALHLAAKLAVEEGLKERYERHAKIAKAYRAAFRSLDLEVIPREDYASPTVTAVATSEEVGKTLVSKLLKDHGIMVGGGLGKLKGKSLRIGHMGNAANSSVLLQFVSALEMTLRDMGIRVNFGSGIEAVYEVLK